MAINPTFFTSLMALLLSFSMASRAAEERVNMSEASELLRQKSEQFALLSNDQALALEQSFTELLRAGPDSDLSEARSVLEEAGFAWQPLDGNVVMLTDAQEKGLGHYLVRMGANNDLMLQAPHQFHDRHTGELAIQLFLKGDARVLALNSAHRRLKIDGRSGNADIAHLDRTVFSPLTRAFALGRPEGVVVQVHGFAANKRDTDAGRTADAIVSSGQRWLQPAADRFARCLSGRTNWEVRRYPLEVGELGGTTNTQGAELRRLGNSRFVHLELSRTVRDRTIEGGEAFAALAHCLSALGGPES